MAQAAHTSQFGTKVWDARRVELPVDGQSAAQPHEPSAARGSRIPLLDRARTSVTVTPSACRQAVLSDVLSAARPVLSDRRECCPRLSMCRPGPALAQAASMSWSAFAARRATARLQRTRTEPALVWLRRATTSPDKPSR